MIHLAYIFADCMFNMFRLGAGPFRFNYTYQNGAKWLDNIFGWNKPVHLRIGDMEFTQPPHSMRNLIHDIAVQQDYGELWMLLHRNGIPVRLLIETCALRFRIMVLGKESPVLDRFCFTLFDKVVNNDLPLVKWLSKCFRLGLRYKGKLDNEYPWVGGGGEGGGCRKNNGLFGILNGAP